MQNKNKKEGLMKKMVIFAGIIVVVFISVAIVKETYRKKQIQDEIKKLQDEADKISKDNQNFQEKIAYLQSQDYQEKEAKDKLNMQNPGESVIIIKPGIAKDSVEENSLPISHENIVEAPNPIKWWNYFFKY